MAEPGWQRFGYEKTPGVYLLELLNGILDGRAHHQHESARHPIIMNTCQYCPENST
jgi:hypothetical protein